MRIAVALSQPPLVEGGAPGRCAVGLLRGLASHGLDVTAVAADRRPPGACGEQVPPDLDVQLVRAPETLSRVRLYAAKATRPRGELSRGSFAATLARVAGRADVVHLEETETGWSLPSGSTPRVLHVHYLAHRDLPLAGIWGADPLRRAEEVYAEVRLARTHDHLLASSPQVADRLRTINPRARITVAPLSLDPAHYEPAPLDGPPLAGLIGTADWPPTRNAVLRLVSRIWPRVRSGVPGAQLVIAGRGSGELRLEEAEGVQVLGEVASAGEFLRSLSVLAYPVSRGSGMKVKVMEALASGVPVVTTPEGAEGIGDTDGVVVETEPDRFAHAVREILLDPGARGQRGAAGRKHFEENLSPGPATEPLVAAYESALGG
ncbi:glycosyltransferase family 4 protein [Kineococcus rhizosphaerae]|uniref:Glycosyltransferase involved in cell wall biosynthesis n=1 Tax=Kineococcus rhizosphaerae TaxID=559628 RepID=A0A2T0RBA1_9ACTN|nr:glycosyltransferase family 4 protein [Kineococcus rhizosphaerae]PRY18433.1 glycosyltransferase involved in cell wall biosynthesis [Kineococcus rhizosphaerae]